MYKPYYKVKLGKKINLPNLLQVDDLRLSNPAYGNTEKRVEALEKGT